MPWHYLNAVCVRAGFGGNGTTLTSIFIYTIGNDEYGSEQSVGGPKELDGRR